MSAAKRIKLNYDMYAVLSDDLTATTPLMGVYIDSIVNRKDISKVIVQINNILPVPELAHLKRIRGDDILLYPIENDKNMDANSLVKFLKESNFDLTLLKNDIRSTQVAKIAPKVRQQFDQVNKLWPCNFHSNKYLEKLYTNTLFSEKEMEFHTMLMKIVVDLALYVKEKNLSIKAVGSLILNPKNNSVVAIGYDQSSEGPCRHSVMVAIDNVAKSQRGGAWNSTSASNSCESKSTTLISQDHPFELAGIPSDIYVYLQSKYQDLSFGAPKFIEKDENGPYLCTGYYLYTTHECCIMCGMALVHSRINRVFYGCESKIGGLRTLTKIHTIKELNHHYEVFGGLLKDRCFNL